MSTSHRGFFEETFFQSLVAQQVLMLSAATFWMNMLPTVKRPSRRTSNAALLKILDGVIRTSHHKGERDNARRHYERLAGKPYDA